MAKIKAKKTKIISSKKSKPKLVSNDKIKKLKKKTKLAPVTTKKNNEEEEIVLDKFLEDELNKSESENEEEEVKEDINTSEDEVEMKEENDDSEDDMESHKVSLAKLRETDPEFFKFLQDNDKKLLDFNLSDSENEEDKVDVNKDDEDEDIYHKPNEELEVASDESDYEPEDDTPADKRVITLKMLKQWQNEIQTDKSSKTIGCLVRAFHAALLRVSSDEDQKQEVAVFKVDGSSVFNAVIQICVLELGPAMRRFLNLPSDSNQPPHKCKKFVKIKGLLQSYFKDLIKLLGGVTSTNILNVLLKHLHNISPLITSFQHISKLILKKLIHLWGTSDDSVRVVAFLCILKITNNQQYMFLSMVLKSMYLTYVTNSKFVSVGTLPMINFMRRSLTEIFALDLNVSYEHVFLYIRQLAIHLRNALTVNKKENNQAVYNWQYINSLKLWGSLLGATCNKPQLQPLIYPFVQVTIGVIKLLPTPQYYPLRLHCVDILIDLSAKSGTFIPILPFLLEVLTSYDFNKRHLKVSMKPLNFLSLLRCSKSQLSENGFKDAVIEGIYERLLEYLANQSHSIAFPDLSFICTVRIKQFIKKCTVANYCKKMRQLLEKIEQNNKFIETERKKITYNLTDYKLIQSWETTIKNNGTPLNTYYESWNKFRTLKKNKQATNNERIGEYDLPTIKKKKPSSANESKEIGKKQSGPVELFPSDSEDDDDDENLEGNGKKKNVAVKKRGTRAGKGKTKHGRKTTATFENGFDDAADGVQDVVEDINISDW